MSAAADLVVGLDAGTSVIKAVAFDLDGRQVAVASRPNAYRQVQGGGVEQDPLQTWHAAVHTLAALGDELPRLRQRLAAVSITGQGDGTWLIDAGGEPVAPAWLWLDARAADIVAEWRRSDVARAVHRITGTGLNTANQSGHLRWLLRHRPGLISRAATAFHCKDWLYFRMTGERATDPSEAVFTFGDFRTRQYSDEVLELLGLTGCKRLLPPIVDGSRHYAALSRAAAAETGLAQGTPVVLAPVDILCTGLGAGLYAPGRSIGCTVLGSTGAHMCLRSSPDAVRLAEPVGYVMPLLGDGCRVQLITNMAATLNIDWFVHALHDLLQTVAADARPEAELLALLDARVTSAPPGRVIYHPFIYANGERGPFVDSSARAQFLGLDAGVSMLDMLRGVYESLGFAARDCYAHMGEAPAEVRLTGGAARSPACRAIMASVLGAPIRRTRRDEAGAAGAAMVATLALRRYTSLAEVCTQWAEPCLEALEPPDPELSRRYDALFPAYRAGYRNMFDFWHHLHRINSGD